MVPIRFAVSAVIRAAALFLAIGSLLSKMRCPAVMDCVICMLQMEVMRTRPLFRAEVERIRDSHRARELLTGVGTEPRCWNWLNRCTEIELSAGQPLNDHHDAGARRTTHWWRGQRIGRRDVE
jgi:hypothetical protein